MNGIQKKTAYMQGRVAFEQGLPNKSNPYPSGGYGGSSTAMSQSRVEWFNGWFDEWRWQKWGPNNDETYVPLSNVSVLQEKESRQA